MQGIGIGVGMRAAGGGLARLAKKVGAYNPEFWARSGEEGVDYETDTGMSVWYDRGSGKGREGMWFDGVDDWITYPAGGAGGFPGVNVSTAEWTIEFDLQATTGCAFSWGSSASNNQRVRFQEEAGGKAVFDWKKDNNAYLFDVNTVSDVFDGLPHHVKVHFDGGTDTISIYVDDMDTPDVTQGTLVGVGATTVDRFGIGYLSSTIGYFPLQGTIRNFSMDYPAVPFSFFTPGNGTTDADWDSMPDRTGMRFDGVDDNVNFGDCEALQRSAFTMKLTTRTGTVGAQRDLLVLQGQRDLGEGISGMLVRLNTSNQLQVSIARTGGWQHLYSVDTFTDADEDLKIVIQKTTVDYTAWVNGVNQGTVSAGAVDYETTGLRRTRVGASQQQSAADSHHDATIWDVEMLDGNGSSIWKPATTGNTDADWETSSAVTGRSIATTTVQTLPDGQASDPGKGFTPTGLCYDSGGFFWAVNFGDANWPLGPTYAPSIVKLSLDGTTILQEDDMTTLLGSDSTLQGIAKDTSDGTFYVVDSTKNGGMVYHLNSTRTAVLDSFLFADANGIAYDSDADKLWIADDANFVLSQTQKNGTVVKSIPLAGISNVDQCYYANGRVWISRGKNDEAGAVFSVDAVSNEIYAETELGIESRAIEGISVVGNMLYIACNDYYHNGTTTNTLVTYGFPEMEFYYDGTVEGTPELVGLVNNVWTELVDATVVGSPSGAIVQCPAPASFEDVYIGDGAYSWHTWPLNIEVGDELFAGSIESDGSGDIQVAQESDSGVAIKTIRTSPQNDDHNTPALNVDPRNGNIFAVSTDHLDPSDSVYMYKSTTGSVNDLTSIATLSRGAPTYIQLYRNPANLDQLDYISRNKPGTFDRWTLTRTTDEWTTDNEYALFREHYVDSVPALDGSGVHILSNDIPLAGRTPTITHSFLRFSDDAILCNGNVAVSDFKTGMASFGNNGQSHNLLNASSNLGAAQWLGTSTDGSATTDKDGATASVMRVIENLVEYQDISGLDNAESYVTSFWAKASEAGTIGVRIPGFTTGDDASGMTVTVAQVDGSTSTFVSVDSNGGTSGAANVPLTTTWQRFIFPAQTGDVETKNRLLFEGRDSVLNPDLPAGFEVAIDKAQVQKGTVSTSGVSTGATGRVISSAELPAIVADANDDGRYFRWVDAWQFVDSHLEVMWAEFDGYDGCDYATLDNQAACQYFYGRLNLTTYQMEGVEAVGLTGDGLDASHTYIGGACIFGVRDVLIAQNNLNGDGKGRLVRLTKSDTWVAKTLRESDDEILRPASVVVQTYAGSNLRHERGSKVTYLEGEYNGFTAFGGLAMRRILDFPEESQSYRGPRDAVQADTAKQPSVQTDAKGRNFPRFDGLNDFLKSTFGQTFAQPTVLAIVSEVVAFGGSGAAMIDGIDTNNRHSIQYGQATAEWLPFAGGTLTYSGVGRDLDNHYHVVAFDGVNTEYWLDGSLVATDDVGPDGPAGLMIGSRWDEGVPANMDGHEVLLIDSPADIDQCVEDVNKYLKKRHGI